MTYIAIIGFIAILGSLIAAMFFMLKGGEEDKQKRKSKANNMARALAFRVGFSVLLFICVLIAWRLGYIHPTGIPAGR
jgi:formate hydrogenlyase subunit 3/multisubunit Na+/H+ antiporter MnhD subunit